TYQNVTAIAEVPVETELRLVPLECTSFWKGVNMSKQPLGKTLLRNVIRHTDAHNKIQEEMEMWKMRGWEMQMSHNKHFPDAECVRGRMHCDRVPDEARDLGRGRERVSEHDDREARYWTRKLYEFEDKDPDRWGHSGFKELYPEEFESDSEKIKATKKIGRHKLKKSKSDTEASLSKHSKKSSRKKKKKKKKKEEDIQRKKAKCSSSDNSSDNSSVAKDKQRRKRTKSRHKDKKVQNPEKERTTAAQGTVTMKKGKNGLAVAKSENRIPTKTQTRGQIQKRRVGKTGKQPGRRAQTILLLTEIQRRGHTHNSVSGGSSTSRMAVVAAGSSFFSLSTLSTSAMHSLGAWASRWPSSEGCLEVER
ncbi:hypothetical protein INR49_016530, partial [Caranx melampygus]